MKNLQKKLIEFRCMLDANIHADWSENDPKLEFFELSNKLQKIIWKNTPKAKKKMIDRLSEMTAGDGWAGDDLEKLIDQSNIDGSVSADGIVSMWEPLEFMYTVDQLLDEIGYFNAYPKN